MKELLELSLEKYYLGGLCPKSQIEIENNIATFKFISNEKNLIGVIKFQLKMKDRKIGIYDTDQLLRLIKIMDDTADISISRNNSAETLLLSDNNYTLQYILSDIKLIPNIPSIDEPAYTFNNILEKDFLIKYIKAYKALKPEKCKIYKDPLNNKINFTLGEDDYSNSADFVLGDFNLDFEDCYFTPNIINEIFENNKNMEDGKIEIFDEGFMKISFNEKTIESVYYLPGLDIN